MMKHKYFNRFVMLCVTLLFNQMIFAQGTTCEQAEPFCAADASLVFPNTTGVSSFGSIACLFTTPNPSWFYLQIAESGDLEFVISQSTGGFNEDGSPIGTLLDVDFVVWGPFTDFEGNCDDLDDCTCPNNTSTSANYPYGNVIDCSYDAQATESMTINNAQVGEYYIVLITNWNGSPGFIMLAQTNLGAPDAGATDCSILVTDNLCPGEFLQIEAEDIEGSDYQWALFNNDSGVFEDIPGAEDPILDVDTSGLYQVSYNDSNGDATVDEIDVLINNVPELDFSFGDDLFVCEENFTITLDATPINEEDYNTIEYTWFLNDVEITGETDVTLTATEIGTYTVEIEADGCVFTYSITIGLIVLNLGDDISLCDQNSYEIIPEIIGVGADEVTYSWNNGSSDPTLIVTETGTYTLEITYDDCAFEDSIFIEFNENPEIDLGPNFETCFENEIFLDASPLNYDVSEVTFEWFLNGVATGQTDAVIEALDYGVYSVIVTAGDCSAEAVITISPREDLEVTLSAPVSACTNEQVTITANTSESGVTYTWFENGEVMDGQTGSSITVTTPSETSNLSFIYGVEIVKGDCSGSAEVEFSVLKCIISQGISPGGSIGQNDILDLEFLANRTGINSLQIFNRLGSLVYERQNYVNEWGGQDKNGNELPTGTYFYLLNFAGEDPVYGTQHNGWIYINRDAN